MGPAYYTLTDGGRLLDPNPPGPATVFFLPTMFFHHAQWVPHGMEVPLSGTCEAGWRASSSVGSCPAGCGSACQQHAPHCGDVESGDRVVCDVGGALLHAVLSATLAGWWQPVGSHSD